MLTDVQCRNATCPSDKSRERFTDSGGLYLEVTPTGNKRWFWKFRLDSKERRMALGNYPVVGLTAARRARDAARNRKDEGKDPIKDRQLGKSASVSGVNAMSEPTFGQVVYNCDKHSVAFHMQVDNGLGLRATILGLHSMLRGT